MMTDMRDRLVVIAELVGGAHDGRRYITSWSYPTRSIYVPVVRDLRVQLSDDDGLCAPETMETHEYRIGNRWCVYNVDAMRYRQVTNLMHDTLYNDRWQVTQYHLVETGA